jgi:hypothetical protein
VGMAADLPTQCRLAGLPAPEPEYPFARDAGRRWRWDWSWGPPHMVALEVMGGGYQRGRHHRPAGYTNDCCKLAAGVLQGWRVFYATPAQVNDGTALAWLKEALT